MDHVESLTNGVDHLSSNTQCLCRACNVAKSFDDAEQAKSCEVALAQPMVRVPETKAQPGGRGLESVWVNVLRTGEVGSCVALQNQA
ncbi:hypothetical protein JZX89_16680 [Agrobacterium sp. Rnr]|uniref:HNH domain-containing protein n=1 Tax=Agrobacterium burrii TaxID=2815339 RepID=A0ABS3EKC0_9HYPH|nr:hypothetical protein [Agrobacterium burrii]